MATVYKAFDTRLERDVAVKIIRTERLTIETMPKALKRFEREAKALGKLTHPNIVPVSDYGEYEGKPYLVMPYLPGRTLKQKLGKPIPWQEAVQLLLPIAEALDYAHSQNMIHRDVKPSNILLTQRGQPMLTDFGIAKILDLEETQDLTGTSAAVGTPEYMAPEQATAKTVDHRADIYALGVVLYEMITGRKPYTADTPLAVLFKHASEPLPRPKQYIPSLPDDVEKVLLKALTKKPDDRYQGMNGMMKDLQRLFSSKKQSTEEAKPARELESSEPIDKRKTELRFVGVGVASLGLLIIVSMICFVSIGSGLSTIFATVTPTTTLTQTFTPTSTLTLTVPPTLTSTAIPTITMTSIPELIEPIIVSPPNNYKCDYRVQDTITFVWEPVRGATEYEIGVDCLDCCKTGYWCYDINKRSPRRYTTSNTFFVFDIPYANKQRWHVRAINALEEGPLSDWWYFDCRYWLNN